MSSPIAIARAPAVDHKLSSSPTGLYIPIHKRGGSVAVSATSPSSSRTPSPERSPSSSSDKESWRSHGLNGRKSPFSERPQNNKPKQARRSPSKRDNKPLAQSHNIPNHSKIPHIYSITDLLILSQSPNTDPSLSLSPEQLHDLEEVIPIIYDSTTVSDKKKSSSRRRRTGRRDRKNSIRAPVVNMVNAEDVENHRKRHGNWGFTKAIPVEEGVWRHESSPLPIAEVVVAL